jgi:MarR family
MSDVIETNVIPMQPVRPLDEAAALNWLRSQPGGRTNLPAAELARRWGWQRYNVTRRLQRWKKDGAVAQQGRFLVAVDIRPPEVATNGLQHIDDAREPGSQPGRSVAVRNAAERASNPLDHYERFQITWSSPFPVLLTLLTFRTGAWSSFALPTRRMPLGRYQDIHRADPGGWVSPRF